MSVILNISKAVSFSASCIKIEFSPHPPHTYIYAEVIFNAAMLACKAETWLKMQLFLI